jgi:cysteinyl-tRNA synthetase
LVTSDAGKMSKSSGEFLATPVFKEKGYDPLAYRYFCFGTHYRKQLEFSWDAIDTSQKNLEALRAMVAKLKEEAAAPAPAPKDGNFKEFYDQFSAALADDVNMAQALAVLWGALRSQHGAAEKLAFVREAEKVLALDLERAPEQGELPAELAALITERETARKNRDFKKSDELRKALSDKGVLIEDTPKGTKWKIVRG